MENVLLIKTLDSLDFIEAYGYHIITHWGILDKILVLWSLSILYTLGVGVRFQAALPTENIETYGIDKVSGYYGVGSWASWLLTTVAYCIDRLLRKPVPNQAEALLDRYVSGIDLNIIGICCYPMIAGFELLRRSSQVSDNLEQQIACIAASYTVLYTGTGVGLLLTAVCLQRWYWYATDRGAVLFAAISTCSLFIMMAVFICVFLGFPPTDLALQVFLLPTVGHRSQEQIELERLLYKSNLVDRTCTTSFSNYLTSDVGSNLGLVVYPILGLSCIVLPIFNYRPSWSTKLGVELMVIVFEMTSSTICVFLACTLPLGFWVFASPPVTLTSVLDLDQLTVLCLGGALVMASTGIHLIRDAYQALQRIRLRPQHVLALLAGLNHRLRGPAMGTSTHVKAGTPLPAINQGLSEDSASA